MIWAEGRTQGDFGAIETPIGYLPKYQDLKILFKTELDKTYSEQDYIEQFSLRIDNLLAKLDRMNEMYKAEEDVPRFFWKILNDMEIKLQKLKENHGTAIISPNK